jgi:hypothetical protein
MFGIEHLSQPFRLEYSKIHRTQGVALGYVIPAFQAEAFKPLRAQRITTLQSNL